MPEQTDETTAPTKAPEATAPAKKTAPAKAVKAPASHAEELRQVEDQWLGKDAPRTSDDKVERGHGSLLSRLTPERRLHHDALEKAVAAGVKHDQAAAALAQAKAALAAAQRRVVETWVA